MLKDGRVATRLPVRDSAIDRELRGIDEHDDRSYDQGL